MKQKQLVIPSLRPTTAQTAFIGLLNTCHFIARLFSGFERKSVDDSKQLTLNFSN